MSIFSICISTRRRKDGLLRLLESLEKIQVPAGASIRIIVVENDTDNNCEMSVREFAARSRHSIDYFLEKEKGLVHARNRSVKEAGDCDFCCFTDDDEVVSPDWLVQLDLCQREFDADGVAGPTYPLFPVPVSEAVRKFHWPKLSAYGTVMNNAYTGCLLLRKSFLDRIQGPFDVRLNWSGGEDIFLTQQITKMGGVLRYNPKAEAFEHFPESRTGTKYVFQRAFRNANTGLYARSFDGQKHYKLHAFPRLVMRFCNGILLTIPLWLLGGPRKLDGPVKIVNAVGGLAFILGRNNHFYK